VSWSDRQIKTFVDNTLRRVHPALPWVNPRVLRALVAEQVLWVIREQELPSIKTKDIEELVRRMDEELRKQLGDKYGA
jgi:hypothetical protein